MVKIIVAGASGRMGTAIIKLAGETSDVKVTGAFERIDHPEVGTEVGKVIISPDIRECIDRGDILIDFTHPSATLQNLKICREHGKGVVLGTTGLSESIRKEIIKISKKIPIVQSYNMSLGVNLLYCLAELTAKTLDPSYDVEIVEAHHKYKKDAPSGTAIELLRQIAEGRKISLDSHVVYGRKGETGARKPGIIGVHAVRGGDVIGDHSVSFLGDGERVELVHKASSRDAFAKGALLAAKFVAKRKSGFYNMREVLGL